MLWKKVMPKLSAGRVQSVATRIIVQRERERMAFVLRLLLGHRRAARRRRRRDAPPVRRPAGRGRRRPGATGRDFGADGRLKGAARALDEASARRLAEALEGRNLTVESVESKPYTRKPYAPFMTSHPAAGRRAASCASPPTARCAAPSGSTRTATSPTCAPTRPRSPSRRSPRPARRPASSTATQYVPAEPRQYTRKVKNAQEAHEAIRPAGESFRTPARSPARSTATTSGSTS